MSVGALTPYGWNDHWAALLAEAGSPHEGASADRAVPGRVIRHDGSAVVVALPDGVRALRLSRRVDPAPTVGDWLVVVDEVPVEVLPRTSLLTRRAAGGDGPQSLAANVDVVLVVCGLDRPVTAGRIDRTVTLAWDAGAVPVVVLTKVDQVGHATDDVVAEVVSAHPGVDVLATSTVTGDGIDALRVKIGTGTVVLLGQSGAGKSSLTNALIGDDVAKTGEVRQGDAKGRHTTATRQAHPLPGGGVLIDTPGLREVGVWVDPEAVDATFAEVDELADGCRFADCAHATEPGCAVTAAVARGTLPAERLEAWRVLEREAAAAQRADPGAQPHLGRQASRTTKDARRRKGR